MKKLFIIIGCVLLFDIHAYGQQLFQQSTGLSGTINTENVNVRIGPNTNSTVVGLLSFDDVKIVGKNDAWYQIYHENQLAWVSQKYVDTIYTKFIPTALTSGQEIIDYGLNFIGTPYVWGGNSLTNGVDCSGFTQGVYEAFNIDISRVSYLQAKDGATISKNDLETGDLVFFDTSGNNNGNISHVGIYIDEGKFIHSDSTNGVMISSLNNPYYTQNYVKSVRVIY